MNGRSTASHLVLAAVRGYQRYLSPLLLPRCRFYPSCSEYAALAVTGHGAVRGLVLALRRLLRCHPFHPGGYDPVPHRRGTASVLATEQRSDAMPELGPESINK
ncbi:MAG: membrane protein insertion efficiency factor YidD [Mycobacteriales bacterium]